MNPGRSVGRAAGGRAERLAALEFSVSMSNMCIHVCVLINMVFKYQAKHLSMIPIYIGAMPV